MSLLVDKVIIVTGGGRGVGRATAARCASLGAKIVLNDLGCDAEGVGRDPDVAEAAAREMRESGAEVLADVRDVSEPGAGRALIAVAVETYGRLDAVVSNAGISCHRRLVRASTEDVQRVLQIGAMAQFELLQAASQHFMDRKHGGAIVLTTGQEGFFGQAREVPRAMAAAAVLGMARSAAVELRKYGIRVNAVAPTARTRQTEDHALFRGIDESSMSPDHVAALHAFLVSDLAKDVHGEVLGVAGSRIYSMQQRETTGGFAEGASFAPDEILAAWDDITRG